MKKILSLLLTLLVLCMAGSALADGTHTVVDHGGNEVEVPDHITRVVIDQDSDSFHLHVLLRRRSPVYRRLLWLVQDDHLRNGAQKHRAGADGDRRHRLRAERPQH